jgi:hypothetical protein
VSKSFPVFRVKGQFSLNGKNSEMVGAVVQVAEDLFEAYYYGFKPAERSIGFVDKLESAVDLFYGARRRVEIDPYPQGLAANEPGFGQHPRGRGFGWRLKDRIGQISFPRQRFLGHTQECACRMQRFGGIFESQCQICGGWSQFGIKHFERLESELPPWHLYAHAACFEACQAGRFCFCGRLGKVWRARKIDARIIWRCHHHRDEWPTNITP